MPVKITAEQVAAEIERMHFVNGKRYQFPVTECGRCGGSGRFSYNPIDGDRCYGCSGTGVAFANRAVGVIAVELRTASKAVKRPVIQDLAVGDQVLASFSDRSVKGDKWVEVVALEQTDDECGWSVDPDGSKRNIRYRWNVTIRDAAGVESVRNVSGCQLIRRRQLPGRIDVAAYVARADAAVEKIARKQLRDAAAAAEVS